MSEPHPHSHADHGHAHAHPHAPSPAAAPALHMRWSVLSLSVVQRVLLVMPMLACLWLAVTWAIKS
jgi:hypothetical protein